jgi:hypothetical protein
MRIAWWRDSWAVAALRATLLSLLIAVAAVAAGCGGDLKGSGGSGGGAGTGAPEGGAGGGGAGGGAGTRVGCGGSGCNHPPAQHRVQGATCSIDRTGGAGGAGGTGAEPELCNGSDAGGGRGWVCTGLNAACCHDQANYAYSQCAVDACATDSDCGPMNICVCVAGTGACNRNYCLEGNCRTDADCGTGLYCSPSRNYPALCRSAYMCHTPDDECIDDSDCNGGQSGVSLPYCAFDGTVMHWRCTSKLAACPS